MCAPGTLVGFRSEFSASKPLAIGARLRFAEGNAQRSSRVRALEGRVCTRSVVGQAAAAQYTTVQRMWRRVRRLKVCVDDVRFPSGLR